MHPNVTFPAAGGLITTLWCKLYFVATMTAVFYKIWKWKLDERISEILIMHQGPSAKQTNKQKNNKHFKLLPMLFLKSLNLHVILLFIS